MTQMKEQYLRLKAPFAAFRPFQSAQYRSTTPIPSPSTVYGLLLNLAAIEQRTDLNAPTTLIRDDLPEVEIAIAIPEKAKSETGILSQQLHQYLVGETDEKLSKKTHGAKPWIAPGRREIIINLHLIVGVRAESCLCDRIVLGLNGELDEPRYGLPFAGDNNFLFDRIEILDEPPLARWYFPLEKNGDPRPDVCRLTLWIDRADHTKTQTQLFTRGDCFVNHPPNKAWVKLPPISTRSKRQ